MELTKKLYDLNGYETEFEAKVLSCEDVKKGEQVQYYVVLDQTLFFPEEGGQSADTGAINGVSVLDVQIKNDIITHTLAEKLEVGSVVQGKIDWKHRFYNMQQHSGEHIFSGLVHSTYGFDNVGFHLSDQTVTMDFNGVLGEKDVADIEYRVNEAIVANIPIEVTFPTKCELQDMEYRSKIEIDGQVRIVTIPGYDVCACCAPHVKRTGEIGMLKVLNVQSYKGGVRISILCGFRALEEFREKITIINEAAQKLSVGHEGLPEAIDKLKNANQSLKSKFVELNQTVINQKLDGVPEEQKDVFLFETDLDATIMRNGVNRLVEKHEGLCGLFSGTDEEGYNFIIGSKTVDCKNVASLLREKLQCRGGGSDKMIQGSVKADKTQILEILQ